MSINTIANIGEKCCGCRSCQQICPVQAISFLEDSEGFFYPQINENCIECGKCLKACPVEHTPTLQEAKRGYAAYFANRDRLRKSSSGGVFAALAEMILEQKGVVFGCGEPEPGNPHHMMVATKAELPILQGSKYVQSDMTGVYEKVKNLLDDGTLVLFSGTPCQVAGLLANVGYRENLYTADIICHGVPSRKMYRAYLAWLEKKTGATVKEFVFRSKEKHDWSLTFRLGLQKGKKVKYQERMATFSPYYRHFLRGMDYRHSCYVCPFAQSKRVSDITLGDFWGIEKVLPDFVNPDGVSAVLINSEKGEKLWEQLGNAMVSKEVPVEKIVENNGQLKAPTKRSPHREAIYKLLEEKGYDALATFQKNKKEELIDGIKDMIPNRTRQKIKQLLKRSK